MHVKATKFFSYIVLMEIIPSDKSQEIGYKSQLHGHSPAPLLEGAKK
jgi:hypothetical protein